MSYKKIGIVIADVDEYKPFLGIVEGAKKIDTPFMDAIGFTSGSSEVIALLCGMGKVNAASGTMYLIDSGCDCILNFGLSGGLKDVALGEFILPESFVEHDFDLTPLGYKPFEKPCQEYVYYADKALAETMSKASGARISGAAACGDRFINDTASRDFLVDSFRATSCDMETAAIASVCHITKTPFAALRRISDGADDDAAEAYDKINIGEGATLGFVFIKCLKGVTDV